MNEASASAASAASEWACVCRYGGVGDNLIVSAILPSLKKKYGRLEVITQEPQGSVFVNNPFIDKLTVRKAGDLPGDFIEWIKWHDLRAGEYKFFANLSHSVEALCAFLPAQLWSRWPVEWRRRFAGAKSYVEAVADVCGIDESAWPECKPRFYATDEENRQAVETFEKQIGPSAKYVGWVVSGSRVDKIYPPSTFAVARLIQDLSDLNVHVILFGAPGRDFEMAKRIVDHVKIQNGTTDRLHSMIDSEEELKSGTTKEQRFPIRRILTQLQHCHVAIGPDTGPMWAVASEPVVAKIMLLSHASERNITWNWENCVTLHADVEKVPCWPCHRLHDTLETCVPDVTRQAAACISSIDVNSIVDECRRALNEADKDQRALDPSKGNENECGRIERDFGIVQVRGEGCGGDPTAQPAT